MTFTTVRNPSVLVGLAFSILEEAEASYQETQEFSQQTLQSLHSVFGDVLVKATELLENSRFTRYHVLDTHRTIITIGHGSEHYTLFEGINYCGCLSFKYHVLESNHYVMCKHVLAVRLCKIMNKFKTEGITDAQFLELCNSNVECMFSDINN